MLEAGCGFPAALSSSSSSTATVLWASDAASTPAGTTYGKADDFLIIMIHKLTHKPFLNNGQQTCAYRCVQFNDIKILMFFSIVYFFTLYAESLNSYLFLFHCAFAKYLFRHAGLLE